MSIPIWVKGLRAGGGATSCALPPVPQSPNSSKLTDIDQQVTGFIGDKQTLIQNQIFSQPEMRVAFYKPINATKTRIW